MRPSNAQSRTLKTTCPTEPEGVGVPVLDCPTAKYPSSRTFPWTNCWAIESVLVTAVNDRPSGELRRVWRKARV